MRRDTLTLKVLIHAISLTLLINVYYMAITDQLGADPVEYVLHFTGIGALNLLILSLAVTPLTKYIKKPFLMQNRRLVGLYAFLYALCHVLSFWAFEIQFNLALFFEEIIERPYITVGMVAFIILVLLAITSWSVVKKRMGRRWQKLHNWVYLAILLGGIHFYWSVKASVTEPVIYGVIITLLLFLRKRKFLHS
ncbi:protein-methionine-sulfoxide reductase heme-binding subunit MsrQ [Thalassotalea sp. 1_MG-2023]|uniref:protein-methionine-sulfoxide reductase heme-binding subunit MsrQ n=1 Tax=Thalassotalea sp. 1_MG-2023 TaxID=3062680 RepID=UPI0026E3AED9|nr:protein-methionine-sulfoxide reductase heme-binding subunit MsrQ [Thalassotalea sp. 1_MG-2023]MDO6426392.1 protein-methionine-sulfoxide reductase heme-binding subunit MsrQ [Thalassotalea sp. 1_MG-2023]